MGMRDLITPECIAQCDLIAGQPSQRKELVQVGPSVHVPHPLAAYLDGPTAHILLKHPVMLVQRASLTLFWFVHSSKPCPAVPPPSQPYSFLSLDVCFPQLSFLFPTFTRRSCLSHAFTILFT